MARFIPAGTLGRLAVVSLGSLAVACGSEKAPPPDSTDATVLKVPAETTLPAPTDGFKVPESVRYDPALDAYFVSNIDGVPSNKDNNGYIVRLDAANPSAPTVVVKGGEKGVTLNAPKGMALAGDTLWVADIDAVRAFDKNTGAVLATIDLAPMGATFLNDVAIAPDGVVYVTDTGIHFSDKGEMTHPGKDRIFAIKDGKATVALEGDALLTRPNGIAWDSAGARFILAPFGGPTISAWTPGEKMVSSVATGPGSFDGVEVLGDGRILVTSWADSSLNVVSNGSLTRLAGGLDAPADIGVDTKRARVAVPLFNLGRVAYVAIPAK